MTIGIYLAPRSEDSRVMIDGNDISESVRSIEVRAFPEEMTEVRLTLSGRVEITGSTLRLFINHEGRKDSRMAKPEQLPTEPEAPPTPDNTLPERERPEPKRPTGPDRPDPGLPGRPGDRPDVGIPGRPGDRPDVGLPGRPGERPEPKR